MFVYLNIKKKRKKFGFRVIHYHLLTNLEIGIDNDIIIPQLTKKINMMLSIGIMVFSSVFSMKDINIIGYLSKYMTKDIDNRLLVKEDIYIVKI